jgi:hypothetical protein
VATLIANYTQPRAAIRRLADRNCVTRIALLEGRENIGKSHLLACLKAEIDPPGRLIIIDLNKRRSVPTPIEILTEIAVALGWDKCTLFDAELDRVKSKRPLQATINHVTINGSYNNVEAVAQDSDEDRLIVALRATEALLNDLTGLGDHQWPLIIALDGFDAVTSLVEKWFDFCLPRLCEMHQLRLVVSARKVPKEIVERRAIGVPAIEVLLSGVTDEQEWMSLVTQLKRRVPGGAGAEQIGFLRGVVQALNGTPGGIMPFLLTLELDA